MGLEDRKFIREFEKEVEATIGDNKLAEKGKKVLVACSGGKDSTVTLYLMNKFGYRAEGLMIDLQMGGWSDENLRNTREFCREHGFRLHVTTPLEELGSGMEELKAKAGREHGLGPCTTCGVVKRWLLNRKARELGASRLVMGHNLDDEAQTCVMNLINGNPKLGLNMGPRTGLVQDSGFVPRIKPLFYTRERDSRRYSKLMGFPVLYKRCPLAPEGQRWKLRDLLDELEDREPGTKRRIVESTLSIFLEMRKGLSPGQVRRCSHCGEPSRSETCKLCQVIQTS